MSSLQRQIDGESAFFTVINDPHIWSIIKSHMFPKKNSCNWYEYTSADIAIANGYYELVKARYKFMILSGQTVYWAAEKGQRKIIKWVLHNRRVTNHKLWKDPCFLGRVMIKAIQNNHMDIIKLWHKCVPYKFELVFDEAIRQKNMEVIDFLLNNNIDKHCTEHTIRLITEYGLHNILEKIFAEFQSIVFDDKAFYYAVAHNNLDMLILLHEHIPDLNDKKRGIINGMRAHSPLPVKRVSNSHINEQTKFITKNTICLAAMYGYLDIMQWLYKNKFISGINIINDIVWCAAEGNNLNIIKWICAVYPPIETMCFIEACNRIETVKWFYKNEYRNVSDNFITIIIDNFNNTNDLNWLKKKGFLNQKIDLEHVIERNNLDIFLWIQENIDNIDMEKMIHYAIFHSSHNILHYLAVNYDNFVDCVKSYSEENLSTMCFYRKVPMVEKSEERDDKLYPEIYKSELMTSIKLNSVVSNIQDDIRHVHVNSIFYSSMDEII